MELTPPVYLQQDNMLPQEDTSSTNNTVIHTRTTEHSFVRTLQPTTYIQMGQKSSQPYTNSRPGIHRMEAL